MCQREASIGTASEASRAERERAGDTGYGEINARRGERSEPVRASEASHLFATFWSILVDFGRFSVQM